MSKERKDSTAKKNEGMLQAIKFTLFSLSAGIIQVLSFTAIQELPALLGFNTPPYLACYIPSLALSVIWNFTFNRKFTFQSASNIPVAMLKVAIFYLIFTPLSSWFGRTAETAGWNPYLIQALNMGSNLVLEFLYQKFFVFRDSNKKKEEEPVEHK